MTIDQINTVRAAIEANEEPEPGQFSCNNSVLDDATGYDAATIDDALEELWAGAEIEGILTIGAGRNPSLMGIRLVLPGRDRTWGSDGRYKPRP